MEHAEIKLGELRLKEEFNLDRKVKGFFNYISIKRKTRENLGPLLNETGKTQDSKKPCEARVSESREKARNIHSC